VADCRGCGHPIRWADNEPGSEQPRIALEVHSVTHGPDRYTVDDAGMAHPVADDDDVDAYQAHVCNRPLRI
jgi:hypothetical protein